ncbi:shikimate kinase [Desulfitobacterium sp. Sab5]|uniref:shikimate kinase n=1 Tax=Desulfitobacterium nosdiversum TaxID=3375356 RepID=UPI003CEC2DF1
MKIRNIVLVGFMGTGKTTVGRRLAKHLNWDFIDTDAAIEEISGMSIPEIFRRHGETRFRSEEIVLVKRLLERDGCVISTGGGTPLSPDNWEMLSQMGYIISLYADIDTILERIGGSSERPLLKAGRDENERLLLSRQPIYDKADLTIDTTKSSIDEVVDEILYNITDRLKDGILN